MWNSYIHMYECNPIIVFWPSLYNMYVCTTLWYSHLILKAKDILECTNKFLNMVWFTFAVDHFKRTNSKRTVSFVYLIASTQSRIFTIKTKCIFTHTYVYINLLLFSENVYRIIFTINNFLWFLLPNRSTQCVIAYYI